jgi:hypothetical protein
MFRKFTLFQCKLAFELSEFAHVYTLTAEGRVTRGGVKAHDAELQKALEASERDVTGSAKKPAVDVRVAVDAETPASTPTAPKQLGAASQHPPPPRRRTGETMQRMSIALDRHKNVQDVTEKPAVSEAGEPVVSGGMTGSLQKNLRPGYSKGFSKGGDGGKGGAIQTVIVMRHCRTPLKKIRNLTIVSVNLHNNQ